VRFRQQLGGSQVAGLQEHLQHTGVRVSLLAAIGRAHSAEAHAPLLWQPMDRRTARRRMLDRGMRALSTWVKLRPSRWHRCVCVRHQAAGPSTTHATQTSGSRPLDNPRNVDIRQQAPRQPTQRRHQAGLRTTHTRQASSMPLHYPHNAGIKQASAQPTQRRHQAGLRTTHTRQASSRQHDSLGAGAWEEGPGG